MGKKIEEGVTKAEIGRDHPYMVGDVAIQRLFSRGEQILYHIFVIVEKLNLENTAPFLIFRRGSVCLIVSHFGDGGQDDVERLDVVSSETMSQRAERLG